MRVIRVLLPFLLAACASASSQDTVYALIWKPKQGVQYKYALSLETTQMSAKVVFGAELSMKVAKVESNGDYTLESTFGHATLTVDGQNEPIEDPPSEPDIQKYNALGVRIDEKKEPEGEDEDNPLSKALSDVMDFHPPEKPVKVGDTWTHAIPADEKKKTRPAKTDYTLASVLKDGEIEKAKVKLTYAETEGDKPAKSEGSLIIGAQDGLLYKAEATITNLQLGPDMPTVEAKVSVTLQGQ